MEISSDISLDELLINDDFIRFVFGDHSSSENTKWDVFSTHSSGKNIDIAKAQDILLGKNKKYIMPNAECEQLKVSIMNRLFRSKD